MKLICMIFLTLSLLSSDSINILDTKKVSVLNIDGLSVTELSALAYNNKTLFALSDKGYLFKYELDIKNKKINYMKLLSASKLKDKKGENLKPKKSDAEGMVYVDDKLIISFERKPKVLYFSLDAYIIKKVKINKQLKKENTYISKNKMLEAVTYSDKYGVITTPELPLKHFDRCSHTLYSKKKTYSFKQCGNITALEFIDEDNILVLYRDMSLSIFNLELSKLNKLDSKKEFDAYSFEGLTKVDHNLYLIVSDNNDRVFQKTLFVLFEILAN